MNSCKLNLRKEETKWPLLQKRILLSTDQSILVVDKAVKCSDIGKSRERESFPAFFNNDNKLQILIMGNRRLIIKVI